MDGIEHARAAAAWAGRNLDDRQEDLLGRYAAWLVEEAIPAGGLGPREGHRLWERHLADSLLFAAGWRDRSPEEILDVGSGVGLPGIPLAILFPECYVTLLDRGGRRTRLLRRIVRILGLPRARVAQGDVFSVADEWLGIVFRGAVKAPEAVGLSSRLLSGGGRSVLGMSRLAGRPEHADDLLGVARALGLDADLVEVPPDILDGPAWLLMMARNGGDV